MRDDKGVTLVAVAITIIVLFIIASISLGVASNMYAQSKDDKMISELGMVQHAIYEQYMVYKLTNNPGELRGTKIEVGEVQIVAKEMGVNLKASDGYYSLSKEDLKAIGIEHTKDVYIVNYEFGEVLNSSKIKTKAGDALYIYAKK